MVSLGQIGDRQLNLGASLRPSRIRESPLPLVRRQNPWGHLIIYLIPPRPSLMPQSAEMILRVLGHDLAALHHQVSAICPTTLPISRPTSSV